MPILRPLRDRSWDLQVACALTSLDMVEPFLSDLGFSRDDGVAARQAARRYLRATRSQGQREPYSGERSSYIENPTAWLTSVRNREGALVADRIAQLTNALAVPGPNHHSWIELMVKLEGEIQHGFSPRLPPDKLAWLINAAKEHLAKSDQIDERLDGLDTAHLSRWDAKFLSESFFPRDYGEDAAAAHFDPRSWLSMLLDKHLWQRFVEQLRSNLTDQELDELVSWGNSVIVLRWPLGESLYDPSH